MPDVFVMKLERAASDECGTPRLDCCDTIRRERSSDADAVDGLSWVSLLSLFSGPWRLLWLWLL